MHVRRSFYAAFLSVTLAAMPVWTTAAPLPAAASTSVGTIVSAQRAHVGAASADVGTTLYGGDQLSTEQQGTVQIRAGAARLLLQGSSSAVIDDTKGAPSARLLQGTATFSTGNAHAFTLFASKAAIAAQSDAPTIGQVTYVNDQELIVQASRGGLTVTVDGETKLIPDGTAYRVIIDPPADMTQDPGDTTPPPSSSRNGSGRPLKAGRNRFLIVAIAVASGVTAFAVYKALESPDRP